jgi:hypothetical protein
MVLIQKKTTTQHSYFSLTTGIQTEELAMHFSAQSKYYVCLHLGQLNLLQLTGTQHTLFIWVHGPSLKCRISGGVA